MPISEKSFLFMLILCSFYVNITDRQLYQKYSSEPHKMQLTQTFRKKKQFKILNLFF